MKKLLLSLTGLSVVLAPATTITSCSKNKVIDTPTTPSDIQNDPSQWVSFALISDNIPTAKKSKEYWETLRTKLINLYEQEHAKSITYPDPKQLIPAEKALWMLTIDNTQVRAITYFNLITVADMHISYINVKGHDFIQSELTNTNKELSSFNFKVYDRLFYSDTEPQYDYNQNYSTGYYDVISDLSQHLGSAFIEPLVEDSQLAQIENPTLFTATNYAYIKQEAFKVLNYFRNILNNTIYNNQFNVSNISLIKNNLRLCNLNTGLKKPAEPIEPTQAEQDKIKEQIRASILETLQKGDSDITDKDYDIYGWINNQNIDLSDLNLADFINGMNNQNRSTSLRLYIAPSKTSKILVKEKKQWFEVSWINK